MISDKKNSLSHELSDRTLFDRIADQYSLKDLISSTQRSRRAIVCRALAPILGAEGTIGTLVEIGCGIGAQAKYLDGMFSKYIGIDYSSNLVSIGEEMFKEQKNVRFIVANIKDRDLPNSIADTILVVGALHHMTNLTEVMIALHRIAKPGCHLVAIEPQRGYPLIQLMRKIRMKFDSSYSSDQHFFSRQEMLDLLDLAPMTDKRVEYQGFLTPPFAQAGIKPQVLFLPLSRLACTLEPLVARLCSGPLAVLSWNVVAYARFR